MHGVILELIERLEKPGAIAPNG